MIKTHRIDRGVLLAVVLAVLICFLLFMLTGSITAQPALEKSRLGVSQDYADTLFDPSRVHCINLRVSDVNWDYMVRHAMEEQYVLCDAEIDGELIENIAIRPKGNSSLASIAGQDSDRFSFKIEFDHYTPGHTFRGLDKLALNNLGQDISCMKDFLTYRMMQGMEVPGPLCAYTLVQLNGKDFGLYLAAEAVEDSFAARNYGDWTGNVYRPDVYAIETIKPSAFVDAPKADIFQLKVEELTPGDRVDAIGPIINLAFADLADQVRISAGGYAGDDARDYSVVFDTAVFDVTDADKTRYISAVRTMCTGASPLEAVDVERMCRYFAVHNFVNNYDSYTGIFAHNYYICEQDGRLSLIPWDYNLGFGAFSAESAYKCFARDSQWYQPMDLGLSMTTEKSFVNYPIDTPLISTTLEERPLLRYLIGDEAGMAAYHDALQLLMNSYFEADGYAQLVRNTRQMLRPYVAKGLTFYQQDAFETAADMVLRYGQLRAESIQGQLDGMIPATLEGQKADYSSLVDPGDLDLSLTIDFGGLAFGITAEEVCTILDAVFADYDNADVNALTEDLRAHPSRIASLILRVIQSSKLISNAMIGAAVPPLLLILTVIVLWAALRRIRRRKGG